MSSLFICGKITSIFPSYGTRAWVRALASRYGSLTEGSAFEEQLVNLLLRIPLYLKAVILFNYRYRFCCDGVFPLRCFHLHSRNINVRSYELCFVSWYWHCYSSSEFASVIWSSVNVSAFKFLFIVTLLCN